jgi:hypothetical protein
MIVNKGSYTKRDSESQRYRQQAIKRDHGNYTRNPRLYTEALSGPARVTYRSQRPIGVPPRPSTTKAP